MIDATDLHEGSNNIDNERTFYPIYSSLIIERGGNHLTMIHNFHASNNLNATSNTNHLRVTTSKDKISLVTKLKTQLENFLNDPNDFTCPISKSLLVEPVLISTGHTFEKESILQWFQSSSLCPNSGVPCNTENIVPNYILKSLVLSYREKHSNRIRKFLKTNAKILFQHDFLLKYSNLLFRVFKKLLAFDEVLKQKTSHKEILDYLKVIDRELEGDVINPEMILLQCKQHIEEKQYATALCALKKLDGVDLENDPRIILPQDTEISFREKKISYMGKKRIMYQLRRDLYSMMIKVYDHFQLNRYTYQTSMKLARLLSKNLHFVTVEDYNTLEYLGLSCSWTEYCEFLESLESVHMFLYGPEEMFQFWNRMSSTYYEAGRWEDQLRIIDKLISNRQKKFEDDESYKFYLSNAYASKCLLYMRNYTSKFCDKEIDQSILSECLHLSLLYNSENSASKKILDALNREDLSELPLEIQVPSTSSNTISRMIDTYTRPIPSEELNEHIGEDNQSQEATADSSSHASSSNQPRLVLNTTDSNHHTYSHVRTPQPSPATPFESQISPNTLFDSNSTSSGEI